MFFALSILADFPSPFWNAFSFPVPHCFALHSSFFNYWMCLSDWELCWGLCAGRMCLDQFRSRAAVSFLLKCMGRSTKKRSKVRLHFNKEPSLSSLMLCCHALQLQRNCALVTENWRKRHWAFSWAHFTTSQQHSHSHTMYSSVMWVQSFRD